MAYLNPPGAVADFELKEGGRYLNPPGAVADFDLADYGLPEIIYPPVPGVVASYGTRWNRPGIKELRLASLFGAPTPREITPRIAANSASARPDPTINARHNDAPRRDQSRASPWGAAQARERALTAPSTQAPPKDLDSHAIGWQDAGRQLAADMRSSFLVATPWKDREAVEQWRSSAVHAPAWRREANIPGPLAIPLPGTANITLDRRLRPYSPGHLTIGYRWQANPVQPKDSDLVAPHSDAEHKDLKHTMPWGPSGSRDTTLEFEYPDYTGPITPPGEPVAAEEKGSYYIMNSVNVSLVDGGTPLDIQNIGISLDVDSWSWQLQGQVIGKGTLALVEPGPSGPVEIEVELNGHTWRFLVEGYSGTRKHGDERYNIQAVSKTQLLSAPYAPERSRAYTTTITAQQIIDDELENTGFTIGWQGVTAWSVTGGAFSYQRLSPIAVAKRIADAAGAILVPHKSAQSLVLQPRLKVSPWSLDAALMTSIDVQIPMAMVTNVALQYQPAPLYDSIYVSGTNAGVANLITRAGAGGTAPAPDVFDDLMTSDTVTTERARQEIGASGNRGIYTLTLPIPESAVAPGLVEPGMVAEIVEGETSWRGYVLGVTITAPRTGAEKLEQSVTIARFYEH